MYIITRLTNQVTGIFLFKKKISRHCHTMKHLKPKLGEMNVNAKQGN